MQRTVVTVTDAFADDLKQVYSNRVLDRIDKIIDLLSYTPEIGSKILPESIVEEFGDSVLKFVIDPFDLIYEYDRENDEVTILALIHQARAW